MIFDKAYRARGTGRLMNESELRAYFTDTILPAVLTPENLDGFDIDVLVQTPMPPLTPSTYAEVRSVEYIDGQWHWKWEVVQRTADETTDILTARRPSMLLMVDRDVDDIYAKVIGNRAVEYTMAEADAQEFKNNGYMGEVPESVLDWATPKQQTAQWAADDILATAAAWRASVVEIRRARLKFKESVRTAVNLDDLEAAQQEWFTFNSQIRAALGLQ